MVEKAVQLGNTTAIRTDLPDGTQLFRTNPADTDTMEIVIVDTVGRMRTVTGFLSTMLIITPTDPIGAVVYDRHPDPTARDGDGRVVFLQRPALSREEVFDMVTQALEKMAPKVQTHTVDDLRKLKLVTP